MLRIVSAAVSHPGLRREQNEDAYCARADLGLYVVADGMGGHAAGEVASRMAVDAIEAFVVETRDGPPAGGWPMPYDPSLPLDGNRLTIGFQLANQSLAVAAAGNPALRGMATTASAALTSDESVVLGHIGDSRIYLWRDGTLRQLTTDHSWVGDRIRAGMLSESDARQHPWRNVVTRAITGGDDPLVDVITVPAEDGDCLMLCSDGLSSVVPLAMMQEVLSAGHTLELTCRALVDAANDLGGPDNITVALLRADVE
ncbi:MAG: PP2C family serine/threonine-protein phosphatase [Vicinamibacterales bacterium]